MPFTPNATQWGICPKRLVKLIPEGGRTIFNVFIYFNLLSVDVIAEYRCPSLFAVLPFMVLTINIQFLCNLTPNIYSKRGLTTIHGIAIHIQTFPEPNARE